VDIKYVKNPSANDIDFIAQQINQETAEYGAAYPFAFFIKDNDSNIIAGANGFILYGSIYTDQLWVEANHRGHGLAKKIMDKVHNLGKTHGCKSATIQTMSFQEAQSFYEKLGYIQDYKRAGYINNSSCIFMKKIL